MTIFPRPSEWARSGTQHAAATLFAGGPQHYFAFLSYSHRDAAMASWLHDSLEKYRVPMHLVGRVTDEGSVPRRLTPIFRDVGELPASGDLGHEIKSALAVSRFLIVLCSRSAASSRWTNAEIEAFKRARPDGCVFAVIVDGEPFASDVPGREAEECLPRALRYKYDRRGRATQKRAEPLAADLREPGEARRLGFLKLVAGMLGVGLDDLVQREAVRRHRHMAAVAGASLLGMLVASALALAAFQGREEARDQRREAESLVAFMLGDLKDKLEPIGRLDALDGVGSRVLAYYSQQNTSGLSDSALLQRSQALSLTAEVASLRGDLATAQRLYGEAMDGTAEAIRRDPRDPQRLFEHAQNVFWTADISRQQGQHAHAEAGMREYKGLADRMVALDPNNMKWRMEQQSADSNLGIMLLERRKFAEAIDQFSRSLATMEALATADPSNTDYQVARTESQSWLADAKTATGQFSEAIAIRQQLLAGLQQLLDRTGDVVYRQKLIPAERLLAELYQQQGDAAKALAHFHAAADHSSRLMALEPGNSRWRYFSARARLNLAGMLLEQGQRDAAAREAHSACNVTARLLETDASVQLWRADMRDCWQMRTRLMLAAGDAVGAKVFAERALETARSVRSTDPVRDRHALAKSYRLLGDIRQRLGDKAGAQAAWGAALSALPVGVAEWPREMAEHAAILQRLGRAGEAQALARRLANIGFKQKIV